MKYFRVLALLALTGGFAMAQPTYCNNSFTYIASPSIGLGMQSQYQNTTNQCYLWTLTVSVTNVTGGFSSVYSVLPAFDNNGTIGTPFCFHANCIVSGSNNVVHNCQYLFSTGSQPC